MTPKQTLLAHLREMHKASPGSARTFAQLGQWHARQHHQFATNHFHEGANLGAGNRPVGWRTGEGAVTYH